MKKSLSTYLFIGVACVGISLSSCKKAEDEVKKEEDTETTSSEDNQLAESSFDDVLNIASEAVEGATNVSRSAATDCKTVTSTFTGSNAGTVTVEFGKTETGYTDCVGADGKIRKGKITVTFSGKYKVSGSEWTITFTDFYRNGHKIEGTKTVKNKGKNAKDQTYYEISVNGKITKSDGKVVTWTSNRTRTFVAGENTYDVSDDIYEITGTASGSSSLGNSYTSEITSPLRVVLNCTWKTVSGTIKHTPSGKLTRTIDFGSGDCDDNATVTVLGNTYSFKLK